jgi:hypothetical protein
LDVARVLSTYVKLQHSEAAELFGSF